MKNKKTKWPSSSEVREAIQELDGTLASRPLPINADPVERFKHHLCAQFVIYLRNNNISQQQLAEKLGVDKSLVSKILHYHYDEFTLDRLIKYLSVLDPELAIEVKTKVA